MKVVDRRVGADSDTSRPIALELWLTVGQQVGCVGCALENRTRSMSRTLALPFGG